MANTNTETEKISLPISIAVVVFSAVALVVVLVLSVLAVRGMVSGEVANKRVAVMPTVLKEMRTNDSISLHTTEWVDYQKGIVRIPIERAMEVMAKESR